MARKEFRTLEEQKAILESRGLAVGDGAARLLLDEDYYCVVNGYKDPFIDRVATSASDHDVYQEGCSLGDLYALFRFDRELREVTLKRIVKAEARVRSVCAYTFSERFREREAYLKIANYTDARDYMVGADRYDDDVAGLIRLLRHKAKAQMPCKDYIAHYRRNYEEVPLWVLVKDLTFGNVSYFYGLQKRSVQNAICKRVVWLRGDAGRAMLTPHEMRLALRTLVNFRNTCAHDERLWCAKAGPVKDDGFSDMVDKLALILEADAVSAFRGEVAGLVEKYAAESPRVGEVLRTADLGLPEAPGKEDAPA